MATRYEGLICPQCHTAYPLRRLGPQLIGFETICYALNCSSCGSQTWRQGLTSLPASELYPPEAVSLAKASIHILDSDTCRKLAAEV